MACVQHAAREVRETTSERGSRTVTVVRMRYERAEQYVNVIASADGIVDIGTTRFVPYVELLPVTAAEWVAYDFASGRTLRVRFGDGGLTVATPAGAVRATKVM